MQNYDVNTMATRQEMRSYVCGQCHVTYYFQPPNKRLTFPWAKGLKVEDIIAVEDEQKIKEWDHPDSGTGLIKARHPEFEMWNQGVHARSGVACADCHMPYMRQGGLKISDHQINSPLLKINRSCQTCHHFPEEELKARVEDIQDRFFNLRNTALDALVDLINDIKAEKAEGGDGCSVGCRARLPAQGPVHDRLRDVGELDGLPCTAGSNCASSATPLTCAVSAS